MGIPITPITDHATRAKDRLPGWLVDATNFKAFLDVLNGPAQVVEDLFNELLNEVSLENAVGAQLDVIGVILNLPRTSLGEPDSEYRARLQGQAAALSQSGEPESVIAAWLFIWTASKVYLTEYQPATIGLTAVATDPLDPDFDAAAIAAMERTIAAGVGTILAVVETPEFLWGSADDADGSGDLPISAFGFGDDADADANGDIASGVGGGNLSRVIP